MGQTDILRGAQVTLLLLIKNSLSFDAELRGPYLVPLVFPFRFDMFGRKYQWVIMGTYTEEWWLHPDEECNSADLVEALHGAILTDLLPITTEKRKTIAGIVSA